MSKDLKDVLDRAVARLLGEGAQAIVLTGSHARGEAHDHSDVDLLAIGDGTFVMRVDDGYLLTEWWTTTEAVRRGWGDPGEVGTTIPGWRSARILADRNGSAAKLQDAAARWRWEELGDAPDRWVAEQLVGLAEEVFRLAGHLLGGRTLPAAVMRNVLAIRMAGIVAVHHRLLYGSENRLWDVVADALDNGWRADQVEALGLGTEVGAGAPDAQVAASTSTQSSATADLRASAQAALRLYRRTAHIVESTLSTDQRGVVDAALRVVERTT